MNPEFTVVDDDDDDDDDDDIYIYIYTYTHTHKSCITLRALNYGNHGILLLAGNAGFISSTVVGWLFEYPRAAGILP